MRIERYEIDGHLGRYHVGVTLKEEGVVLPAGLQLARRLWRDFPTLRTRSKASKQYALKLGDDHFEIHDGVVIAQRYHEQLEACVAEEYRNGTAGDIIASTERRRCIVISDYPFTNLDVARIKKSDGVGNATHFEPKFYGHCALAVFVRPSAEAGQVLHEVKQFMQ